MGGILAIMGLSMFGLSSVLSISIVKFSPFFLWGTMGWASQAPQQHLLLLLQPDHGAAAVALNSSANYFGSAVVAALGGVVMLAGLLPSQLPLVAGGVILVALVSQLVVISRGSIFSTKQFY